MVRPAAAICRLIQTTKFSPAGESHACTLTVRPACSSTSATQVAHASSAPVYETKKSTRSGGAPPPGRCTPVTTRTS
jgi:hypothetical protein